MVVPVPKSFPPVAIRSDLRPISETSGISKVAKSLICSFLNSHFNNVIDVNALGVLRTAPPFMH